MSEHGRRGSHLSPRWDGWYVCAEFPDSYAGGLSEDGRYMALVPFDAPPRVVRTEDLSLVSETGDRHLLSLALSPDGKLAAGTESTERMEESNNVVWDVQTGREISRS